MMVLIGIPIDLVMLAFELANIERPPDIRVTTLNVLDPLAADAVKASPGIIAKRCSSHFARGNWTIIRPLAKVKAYVPNGDGASALVVKDAAASPTAPDDIGEGMVFEKGAFASYLETTAI
jgi:hypothetical protein